MEEEDNKLLLTDLCARLPYHVKISYNGYICTLAIYHLEDIKNLVLGHKFSRGYDISDISIKPFLRPMSSMTDEERKEYEKLRYDQSCSVKEYCTKIVDFFISHHFDYRGLLEKGLAIEAPEGMYNLNKK